jgi:hypothetical protein
VKAPTLFEVAISDQSRDYLEMIWNGFYPDPRINANHRAALYLDADFKLDFTNGLPMKKINKKNPII